MEYSVKTSDVISIKTPCLVVGVFESKKPILTSNGKQIDKASKKALSSRLSRGDLRGKPGSTQMLYDLEGINAERVLMVGLGKEDELNQSKLGKVTRTVVQTLKKNNIKSAELCFLDVRLKGIDAYRKARIIVEAAEEALYQYDSTKSKKKNPPALKKVSLLCATKDAKDVRLGVSQGKAIAHGMNLAKDLSNLPGNVCTPTYLAKRAKDLQKSHKLKTSVLDEAQMKKLKMGSLLSVSRGSREPAKLIIMEYRGGKKSEQPIVLVGKGLTFDAGGISLKPAGTMDEMKYDMCGGASVFGAMQAVAELGLNKNVIGIVPSSENLPDGAANKPGDIVTSMSGTTIEILNTDAEGRLILCDALTYAERYKPAAVIDIATLTGACMVALGQVASGLFSDSDKLSNALIKASEKSGDRAWRMPVWDEYMPQLHSPFADVANIGGRYAGAVTAACFLKKFTEKYEWAHLDVAGTAWKSGGDKGATGRPVPLLMEYLING